MKVAVFGASGFVGSAIMRELALQGHEGLGSSSPRLVTALRDPDALAAEASKLGSSMTDLDFGGARIVINAAGLARPGDALTDELVGANSLLPASLAIAAARAGVKRFVHVSSTAVYGSSRTVDETLYPRPASPYGQTKLLGERVLYLAESPQETVVYRPPSVHGIDRSVTHSLRAIAKGPFSTVAGRGDRPSPQALVENVAAAAAYLAFCPRPPSAPVNHPWEGVTTAGILTLLSDREPRKIPTPIAAMILSMAKAVGRHHPRLNANVRRLEMMWLGQRQADGWFSTTAFRLPYRWREADLGSLSKRLS